MASNKIIAPSFAFNDIYGTQRALILVGGLICFLTAISTGVSFIAYKNVFQDQFSMAQAVISLQVTTTFLEKKPLPGDVAFNSVSLNNRLDEDAVRKIKTNIFIKPIEQSVSSFIVAWEDFSTKLAPVNRSVDAAEDLRLLVSGSSAEIQSIGHHVELSKDAFSSAALIGFSDSLGRLITYGETNIGARSAARIEYDAQVLAYNGTLANNRNAPEVKVLEQEAEALRVKIQRASKNTRASMPTQSQIIAISASASNALEMGHAAQAELVRYARLLNAVIFSSLFLFAAGVSGILTGFTMALSEFSARFKKSTSQFRKSDQALVSLVATVQTLSYGDFSIDVPNFEDKALSDLSVCLNQMILRVRDTLSAAEDLVSAAQDRMQTAHHQISSAEALLESQKNKMDAGLIQASEMHELVNLVILDVSAAASANKLLTSAIQDSTRSMLDSVENMDAIRDTVFETTKRIKQLGERSQEISSVVTVLSSFSQQINILAMNASLEAVRAGEQGAGFSVVAKEIRRLSATAEESVSKVFNLVQDMQADTREAINALEKTTNKVVAGAHISEMANGSVDVIRTVADRLQGGSYQITQTIKEQLVKAANMTKRISESQAIIDEIEHNERSLTQNIGSTLSLLDELKKSFKLKYMSVTRFS